MAQLWGVYLSVISLLGLIGTCFGEDPYVYFDWRVSYITAAPLGVKQQVLGLLYFSVFRSYCLLGIA